MNSFNMDGVKIAFGKDYAVVIEDGKPSFYGDVPSELEDELALAKFIHSVVPTPDGYWFTAYQDHDGIEQCVPPESFDYPTLALWFAKYQEYPPQTFKNIHIVFGPRPGTFIVRSESDMKHSGIPNDLKHLIDGETPSSVTLGLEDSWIAVMPSGEIKHNLTAKHEEDGHPKTLGHYQTLEGMLRRSKPGDIKYVELNPYDEDYFVRFSDGEVQYHFSDFMKEEMNRAAKESGAGEAGELIKAMAVMEVSEDKTASGSKAGKTNPKGPTAVKTKTTSKKAGKKTTKAKRNSGK